MKILKFNKKLLIIIKQDKGNDSTALIYITKPTSALVIDVTDSAYGAKRNRRTDDTAAIQKAINFVAKNGGGTVHIPDGYYRIDTISTFSLQLRILKFHTPFVIIGNIVANSLYASSPCSS